jgi:hypothetical protein
MKNLSKVVYIVVFSEVKKPDIVLYGIEALARFSSNDLYTVEGLSGRRLTEVELNKWESLTVELFGTHELFDTVELPRGFVNR